MSSKNHWHARDHEKALSGYMGLTLEQRAAYTTVLDLLYLAGEPIADNERMIAAWLECSRRKWRSLRDSLIESGKIYYNKEGKITNKKCEEEFEKAAKMSRKRAENGAKGGRKSGERRKKANKNNGDSEAKRSTTTSTTTREDKSSLCDAEQERDLGFDRFWDLYPDTQGQDSWLSRGQWNLMDDGQRERCIASLEPYRKALGDKTAWFPYNYLKNRIFENVLVAPKSEIEILLARMQAGSNHGVSA